MQYVTKVDMAVLTMLGIVCGLLGVVTFVDCIVTVALIAHTIGNVLIVAAEVTAENASSSSCYQSALLAIPLNIMCDIDSPCYHLLIHPYP